VAVVVVVTVLAVAVAVVVAAATSRISARASHQAHTMAAEKVSIGYLIVGRTAYFASPKKKKKTEERRNKTTTDMPVCVCWRAQSRACACVRVESERLQITII
jgi:hypothetical protein